MMTDAEVAAGLGTKLDALDLTAEEHALLTDLLTPDDGDGAEVVGFGHSFTALLSETPRPGLPRAAAPGRPMFRAQ